MERSLPASEVNRLAKRGLETLKARPNASVAHKQKLANIIEFTTGLHHKQTVTIDLNDWMAISTAQPAETGEANEADLHS